MSDDERRLYFSNSDFEKVAADIISSPRRLKQTDGIDSLFRINEKQQEYYTKCFRHLIKTTQGVIDMNSAICGADHRIVAFFKRSSLDVASLSKIWSLADVNEDGYLDIAEFSIAMHLVVLRVKGEIPIPDVLPQFAKPPLTPPRSGSQDSQCSGSASISNAITNESQWEQDTRTLKTKKDIKVDDERVNPQPIIKQFSNTPPLLVDSRPTAIKHSALLALKSPSGPPPIPPQRPQQRGHARSASLDLKLIALNNGRITAADPSTKAMLPPSSLALWSSNTNPPSTTVDFVSNGSNLLTTATSIGSSPPSTQPPSVSTTTTTFASFPGTPDSLPVPAQSNQNRTQNIPPPIPQRISPSPIPKPIISTSSVGVQTETKVYDEEEVNTFFQGFGAQLDNLLGEEVTSSDGKGLERWSKRCIALRQQNSELEAERARLAQVRIQLEIRLQEIEERPKNPSSSSTL